MMDYSELPVTYILWFANSVNYILSVLFFIIIVAHNDDMSRIPTPDMIASLGGTRCGLNSFEVDKSGLSGNVRPSCYESS